MKMDDANDAARREHILNTQWQNLLDKVFAGDAADYVQDTNLGLEILSAAKLPLSWEILRVGSIKVSDAYIRKQEEKESEQ